MSKLKIQDYEIYYEVVGNQNASDTIVFLNGVMASCSSWSNQVRALKRDYKIILQDFKGQTLSDKPVGPYTFAEHANDVLALLDHLGISKVHLVGTSYGGEVAMRMAIDHPDYVKTISVIDSVSELDDLLIGHINHWKMLAALPNKETFFHGMTPSIYGASFMNRNKAMLEERAIASANLDESYFKGQLVLYDTFLQDVTMSDELHKITCPALVVVGEEDTLKPVKFSKIIHEKIQGSEFVIVPDCGHVMIFEKFEELNTLLLGFLSKHSR